MHFANGDRSVNVAESPGEILTMLAWSTAPAGGEPGGTRTGSDVPAEAFATDTGPLSGDEQIQHAQALAATSSASGSTPIRMANDDLILYVRKQHPRCGMRNPQLGKLIWARIQHGGGAKVSGNQASLWSDTQQGRDKGLPMVSTQFEFPRSLLPELFTHLDFLGGG